MKKITDVAEAANVSVSTVSKVLNGYKGVGSETREKVIRAAQELDYFPNHAASQLVNRREDTICVMLSSIGYMTSKDEFLVGLLSGIYHEAEARGLRVVIFTPDAILNMNQNYVQFCRSNNYIGFIIHGLQAEDPQIAHLAESEVPCVFIDNYVDGKKTATVSIDNRKACEEVVDKLVALGHRKITFVAGSLDSYVGIERKWGYDNAMEKHQLSSQIVIGEFCYEDAYENVRRYILDCPETTALFCASDAMAAGAVNACLDSNFKVPKDISVFGFDDLSFASYFRPRLSTVVQNFYVMGAESARVLLQMFEGKDTKKKNYIDYKIEMRQSAAKNSR